LYFFLGLVDEEFDQLSSASLRSLFEKSAFPKKPSKFQSLDDFNLVETESSGSHGHRTKGYFLATESGKHQFFASCTSGCQMYMSNDDSCNKRNILFVSKKSPGISRRYNLIFFINVTFKIKCLFSILIDDQ